VFDGSTDAVGGDKDVEFSTYDVQAKNLFRQAFDESSLKCVDGDRTTWSLPLDSHSMHLKEVGSVTYCFLLSTLRYTVLFLDY
jgi:hypothetical protein